MQKTLGLSTAVIVSPGGYGRDYTMLADVLAKYPDRFRGIALVKDDMPASELARLDQARRARHADDEHQARQPRAELRRQIAARVHEHGWHIQFYPHGTDIIEYADKLLALKNDIVLDHFASIPAEGGVDQPAMKAVMKMLDTGRVWLKLSGPMRCTLQNVPYPSVTPMARAFVKHAPERMVWGSDWPHVNLDGREMPDDGDPARPAARMGARRSDAQAHPGRQPQQALRILGNAADEQRDQAKDSRAGPGPRAAFAERADAAERTRRFPRRRRATCSTPAWLEF